MESVLKGQYTSYHRENLCLAYVQLNSLLQSYQMVT